MTRLPTLFLSHGSPMYALQPGRAGAQLRQLGERLPRPKALAVVSPHWMTRTPRVFVGAAPATIHDFGGFDPALHEMRYPAPGHPELATRTVETLRQAGWHAESDASWGLDHGAWVPLMHLYPQANVPVFQVSMPHMLDAASAYRYGQALAPLSDQGVLVVGSGSLTHNLRDFALQAMDAPTYAAEFTEWIRTAVLSGDADALLHALERAPHARRAHPTVEHFLPLLVALGAAVGGGAIGDTSRSMLPSTVLPGGVESGVLSMESYLFGATFELAQL